MLKSSVKRILQKILGFDNYLFIFSIFTIRRMRRNQHEKEFAYFMDMIPNEGAILDIGANIGIMTVTLAEKFNKAKVYSFEPMPQNVHAFKRIVKYFKLGNVTLFDIALGDEKGELKMVMPVLNNVKMQGLSHVVENDDNDPMNQGLTFKVPVKKLDDIEELKALPKINAIKIDVENFEYPVLKGGRALLQKHKPVIYCELWKNERRDLALNYLKELGYTAKVLEGDKMTDFKGQDVTNFIMVPPAA
jgi:FkbM family methyltransferase